VPGRPGRPRADGRRAMLRAHMSATGRSRRAIDPDEATLAVDAGADADTEEAQAAVLGRAQGDGSGAGVASGTDASGVPVHRGWAPLGGHHRWMEPFVLAILAGGAAHGYGIIGDLTQLGITNGPVDVGQVYRTLRDLEEVGQVRSTWSTAGSGPARRDYDLTGAGYTALDEWAALMKERARLIAEFDARYLEWVAVPRR
jgi:PadR family transcriptional regulator